MIYPSPLGEGGTREHREWEGEGAFVSCSSHPLIRLAVLATLSPRRGLELSPLPEERGYKKKTSPAGAEEAVE